MMSELEDKRPQWTLALSEEIRMTFISIPKGRFRMGARGYGASEEPVHEVVLTQDYWLGQTPVTQAQYALWQPKHKNGSSGNPQHPAENMDWTQARAYCQWLNETFADQLDNKRACLPTEAQWERACRANRDWEYGNGDGEGVLETMGWYGEKLAEGSTHPVAQKEPNGWGLYDMHGNVWEWCEDVWDEAAYLNRPNAISDPVKEGDPTDEHLLRVIRGGSWSYPARLCRSAYRFGWLTWDRSGLRGFRVCLLPQTGD